MQAPAVRPRISLLVPLPADRVVQRLEARLSDPAQPFGGAVSRRHVDIVMPAHLQHTWSPQLSLCIDEHPQGAHVSGRFGPHPHVWTFFVALYALSTFLGIAATMFGWSQSLAGQPAWALWGLPLALVLGGASYGGALLGQRLGANQMAALLQVLTEALPEGQEHAGDPSP